MVGEVELACVLFVCYLFADMQAQLKFDQKVTIQEIIVGDETLCNAFVNYLSSIHAQEALEFWIEVGMIPFTLVYVLFVLISV